MRYLPLTPDDRAAMLAKIGAADIDALFRDVPKSAVVGRCGVRPARHAGRARGRARAVAAGGARTWRPERCRSSAARAPIAIMCRPSVDHLIQRSEFLTSYTPYQPEIAQGTLQYLFEFQTQVALLTGMEVANASLYDGSTATAEAVLMAQRVTRRTKAILSGGLHPHYAETVETVAEPVRRSRARAGDARQGRRHHRADRRSDRLRRGAEPGRVRPDPRSSAPSPRPPMPRARC